MAEVDGGCVFLARKILESDIWHNKPAWWLKVWLYLIIKVNHTDKGKFKRGQGFFRLREIQENCQLFDIKTGTIKNALQWLKSTLQITTQKTPRGVIITICNYNKYQILPSYKNSTENSTENSKKKPRENHANATICNNERIKNVKKENTLCPSATSEEKISPQKQDKEKEKDPSFVFPDKSFALTDNSTGELIEKDNKVTKKGKEGKQKYMDRVFLTVTEHDKLIEVLGGGRTADLIEDLDNYIGRMGKDKYKSHYLTILNWDKNDRKKNENHNTGTDSDIASRKFTARSRFKSFADSGKLSDEQKSKLRDELCKQYNVEEF